MHGGIGFTWDHDLHLYLRRAFESERLLGSSDWHRDRLAELVL
jgi:alkylation response protein AidB-like acyl-CoA dehydrogenase